MQIYTILEENEPNNGNEEDSEPCPELTNEQTSEELSRENETEENEGGADPRNYRQVGQTGEQERAARPVRRWPQQSPDITLDKYKERIRDRQRRLLNTQLGHPDPMDAERSPVR